MYTLPWLITVYRASCDQRATTSKHLCTQMFTRSSNVFQGSQSDFFKINYTINEKSVRKHFQRPAGQKLFTKCLPLSQRLFTKCLRSPSAFWGSYNVFLCVNVYSCKQNCFLTPKTHSKSGKQQFVNILYTFCKQFVPSSYTGCVRNIRMCKQFVHRLCKKSNITH